MRLNRCFLGAGLASALVAVAVQKLWLLRTSNLGERKAGDETSRDMERKEYAEKTIMKHWWIK
jgi:hypothetical protein